MISVMIASCDAQNLPAPAAACIKSGKKVYIKSKLKAVFLKLTANDWSSKTFICSMADGISFDVSLSLNCTDLYKRGGGA